MAEQDSGKLAIERMGPRVVTLLMTLVLTLPGCSKSDRATVSGTLLHGDGSPLVGARVIARSKEGRTTARSWTDNQGRFALGVAEAADGVPPGEYVLFIVEDRGDADSRRPATIAAKYQNPETSGITVRVQAGEKTVLDLKLDPP